jgi:hypothetical protein
MIELLFNVFYWPIMTINLSGLVLLVHHLLLSQFQFYGWAELPKKKKTKLGCEKCFSKSKHC